MTETTLATLTITGARATITLDRPARHNAIEAADLPGFTALLDEVEATPDLRVLVLTGRGAKTFSSGFNIGDIATTDWQENPFEILVDRIEGLALPTLCALNGAVYGGATDLALACDFRIGVTHTKLRVPAAELGVFYYVNGLRRFVERLGPNAARRIFLASEEFDASALLAMGYLDRVVPAEALDSEADALATRLADAAPLAVRGMKQAIIALSRGTLDEAAARGDVIACFGSADAREGATAFRERHKPRFTGK